MGKIFANHMSDKDLLSKKKIKNPYNLLQIIKKIGRELEQKFFQRRHTEG